MKLTLLFMTIGLLQVSASVYSQTTKLTLAMRDAKVVEILDAIENQSEFRFAYSPGYIDLERKLSVDVKEKSLEQCLKIIFNDTGVEYAIRDRHILLFPGAMDKGSGPVVAYSLSENSQQRTVSGKVTDSGGQPLPGVSIVIKGTTQGTVTDANGSYSLSNIPADAILVFSFVGMRTQEVPVGSLMTIDISMKEDVFGIEEVVAIGYGTQKKENVIGSISTISSDELTVAPVGRIGNALIGRLPGATVMQRSGEPGYDSPTIRIRGEKTLGDNSPLIVVDGIPGSLNLIDREDIESITVLKDASAAIYGARAANGVILVTTKRGDFDQAPKITYSVYSGALTPTELPKMTDAATYATMRREYETSVGTHESNMQFSEEDIAKYASGEYPWTHPNTDWFKEGLRKHSSTLHHSLSVNGGSKTTNYYASFGHQADDGIYKNNATYYKQYTLKAVLNVKIGEYLKVGLNSSNAHGNSIRSTRSSSTIYTYLIRMYPTAHAYFPNGFIGPDIADGNNPLAASSDVTGFDDDKDYRSNNIFSADLKIPGVEGLTLSGYFAYNVSLGQRKLFQKPWTLYSFNKDAYLDAGNTGKEDGSAFLIPSLYGYPDPRLTNTSSKGTSKTTNLKLDYSRVFLDNHDVSAFVSYENYDGESISFDAFRRYFTTDRLPYLFAGGDLGKDNSESVSIGGRVNYFGRLAYNFKETYLFQFTFRRDGSLNFSKEAGRWGNFPSLLFGWRPSNYEWWKNNVKFINYLKLKASWGQMGNDAVAAFQYLSSYKFSRWGYQFGKNKDYRAGIEQANVPNPNITWEVSNMYNVGWESLLFDNRITFDADFFYEKRQNILVKKSASIPVFTGLTLPDENFGIVDSRGFEVVLGYQNSMGDFNYRVNGNFSFARNKIIEFDEPERAVPWQRLTGKPQGALLLYKSIGIFRDEAHVESYPHIEGARPGDVIFEDFDGDGKITNDDRQLFPLTKTPEITYALTFDFGFKNFELNGLLHGAGRGINRVFYHIQGYGGNYFQWSADDRWTPENINASMPRAFERQDEYWRNDNYPNDYDYMPISFLRVKNLQLKYNFPTKLLNNAKIIDRFFVYASAQNPWILYSKNKIIDPEANSASSYPLMKVFSLGVNITIN